MLSPPTLILQRLGRFILIGVVSFGIGMAAVYERYNNYWGKTIYRVQTVDFNILSHTLPTKLSYTIIKNQPQELQRTLNSNYGLFGLVVTDPSGQNIVASSQSSRNKTVPEIQQLQKHPYDLLLDPPPVYPQWTYSNSYAVERSATNLTNQGRVIGRIYYVRGEKPSFSDDVVKWLSNPLSSSSRVETFTITMTVLLLSGLSLWLLLENLLDKKRVQEERMRETEENLIRRNRDLVLQLQQRINETNRLRRILESESIEFQEQAEQFRNINQSLQQEISNLQNTIEELEQTNNSAINQDVNELNRQLEMLQNLLAESINQEEESRNRALESAQQIERLNQEIESLIEQTGNHPLNAFEESVLHQIKNNLDTQEIHTHFDAGTGGEQSRFIDLLVITNNCIFVIEAKAYRGEIIPTNDPRNSTWICRRGNDDILIQSSWGPNPYQQVNTYTDAILAKRSREGHPRKPVYGIIVFPSEANIRPEITLNMGRYYRATTQNNLLATIKRLNR